ncbi:MAG TPA: ATP synthase F0 subunit C [Bacilli bacterium]|nr:ATP synthase F0 subunit C [Bacilli bacterium]HPY79554.1 ATP synthase F0 subunit C [Bacilli bacterium]HQA56042.1 ATP synthase F0 subunit C [Bacilli bacterium]
MNILAAAIAIWGVIPSGAGEAWVCVHAIDGISRNPEAANTLRNNMILACALVETTAIYSLLVSILCIFLG